MDATDTGAQSGNSQAAPAAPLTAPYLGSGSKRRSKIEAVSVILVIILIAVVLVAVTRSPTKTTSPYIPPTLMQRSNVLFGVPAAPAQYEYYNASLAGYSPSYTAQYGFSFMQPILQGSAVVPPNTTIQIPQQYSNITSPVAVGLYVQAAPSHAAAISNYTAGIKAIESTFPSAAEASASVGNMSSVFSYKVYGLNMHTLLFVNNNYYVVLNTLGTPHLNQSYLMGIAAHINSLISSANS